MGRALALVLLSLLPGAPVNGQPRPATPALAACVTRAGGEDAAAFLAFDAELRAALAAGDASLVTLLTAFPLRITDGTARVLVADAASLAGRGAQGLPAAVRAEVSAAPLDALICRFDGIGYAGGQLWVRPAMQDGALRFGIAAVTLPASATPASMPTSTVAFACRTAEERLVVDAEVTGTTRLRGWTRPHPITAPPDVDVHGGVPEAEGTGACARRTWRFTAGARTYALGEIGCGPETPPTGAIGRLTREPHRGPTERWCY